MAWNERWLLVCLQLLLADAGAKHGNAEFRKVALPHHSFSIPIEFTNLLGDWMLSGASIFERDRLLLHPGVLERQGFAFNKRPLQTNDFQVTVGLRTNGPAKVTEAGERAKEPYLFVCNFVVNLLARVRHQPVDYRVPEPAYDVMAFQVSGMIDSLNQLDRDCRLLTKEMKILDSKRQQPKKGPQKKQNNLEELKSHEGKAHLNKLEASGSSMLNKLVDQTRLLEESVLARSSQMTVMLFILLVVIVVIGVLMFNRMRYYEKKHFI
eukprot:Skav219068  [mRNA]  locus=scaffold1033:138472:156457:- [translate_table: standard]